MHFWAVPREAIKTDHFDVNIVTKWAGTLIFKLLFGGPLTVTESSYLNMGFLRKAMQPKAQGSLSQTEELLRGLCLDGHLSVTKRENTNLLDIRDSLTKDRGGLSNNDNLWYHCDEDLIWFENETHKINRQIYNINDAANHYVNEFNAIISKDLSSIMSEKEHDFLRLQSEKLLTKYGTLRWSYFSTDGEVWDDPSLTPSEKFKDLVYRVIGQAPFVSFFPKQHNLSPIYMADTRQAVNLMRGRQSNKKLDLNNSESKEFKITSKHISLSQYPEALCSLRRDDINEILISKERSSYLDASEKLIDGKLGLEEFWDCLMEYRGLIDKKISLRKFYQSDNFSETLQRYSIDTIGDSTKKLFGFTVLGFLGLVLPSPEKILDFTRAIVLKKDPKQEKVARIASKHNIKEDKYKLEMDSRNIGLLSAQTIGGDLGRELNVDEIKQTDFDFS